MITIISQKASITFHLSHVYFKDFYYIAPRMAILAVSVIPVKLGLNLIDFGAVLNRHIIKKDMVEDLLAPKESKFNIERSKDLAI